MTPPVRLETSGGVLSTVDLVVQQPDGPRRLRDDDDNDDDDDGFSFLITKPRDWLGRTSDLFSVRTEWDIT